MNQEPESLLKLINTVPALQSLLYDIDMMPEQVTKGGRNWELMLAYALAYQAGLAASPNPKD